MTTSKPYFIIVSLLVFMGTISILWVAEGALAVLSTICQEGCSNQYYE